MPESKIKGKKERKGGHPLFHTSILFLRYVCLCTFTIVCAFYVTGVRVGVWQTLIYCFVYNCFDEGIVREIKEFKERELGKKEGN